MRRWFVFVLASALAACASTPVAPPALSNLHAPVPGVFTAGRVQPEEVRKLADHGFRQVIDLTVDSETPEFDEAAAVRAAGIHYENLPIRGPQDLTLENVQAFDRLLSASPRPLLVRCASSNRVGAMAALRAAWIDGVPEEAALEEGRRWGLKGLEPAVRERLAAGSGERSRKDPR